MEVNSPTAARIVNACRLLAMLASPFLAIAVLRWTATTDLFVAPIHRRLWATPHYAQAGLVYRVFITAAVATNAAWVLGAIRNFITITAARHSQRPSSHDWDQKLPLPPWPYKRDSFAVILGELQDRDGSRVPNERSPHLKPRWLVLPELSLYTGVFVTGGIGSGKTSAVAYPALKQLLGFRRDLPLRQPNGSVATMPWKFSGLVLDEKGDFTRAATRFAEKWGRADDIIRIAPGGKWIWNVIYNPSLPSWAVAYQLGWILKNFNKGLTGGDPFWENAPKELVTDYLGLLDDAAATTHSSTISKPSSTPVFRTPFTKRR